MRTPWCYNAKLGDVNTLAAQPRSNNIPNQADEVWTCQTSKLVVGKEVDFPD